MFDIFVQLVLDVLRDTVVVVVHRRRRVLLHVGVVVREIVGGDYDIPKLAGLILPLHL